METSKQITERLMAMTHAKLMMHCQDLTAERDRLKASATLAAEQIRKCDYTQARSTLLMVLKGQDK